MLAWLSSYKFVSVPVWHEATVAWAVSARERVQVLPRRHTDARTYNMVVSVCVKAADLQQVLSCLVLASYLAATALFCLRSARKLLIARTRLYADLESHKAMRHAFKRHRGFLRRMLSTFGCACGRRCMCWTCSSPPARARTPSCTPTSSQVRAAALVSSIDFSGALRVCMTVVVIVLIWLCYADGVLLQDILTRCALLPFFATQRIWQFTLLCTSRVRCGALNSSVLPCTLTLSAVRPRQPRDKGQVGEPLGVF